VGKHSKKLSERDSHKHGCVSKHESTEKVCDYRANGYEEMKGAHLGMYNIDFTKEPAKSRLPRKRGGSRLVKELKSGHKRLAANHREPDDPSVQKDAWWFGSSGTYKGAKGQNYGTAYLPFNHNYHHILPATSLGKLPIYIRELLQLAAYWMNGPENMIILPCTFRYGQAMLLPDHPGAHTTYNGSVMKVVADIRKAVEKAAPDHKITDENKGKLKAKLVNWQKAEFKLIVAHGKTMPQLKRANQTNTAPIATPSGR
jgi:hypothetical protein